MSHPSSPSPLPEALTFAILPTPIGEMTAVVDERGVLRALNFDDGTATPGMLQRLYPGVPLTPGELPAAVPAALAAYFAGDLAAIHTLAWAVKGPPFQEQVWRALASVPPGTTTTYGALAKQINAPKAVRAVGAANGANPISLVLPCHRVIGTNGKLTGYGGGLHRKEWLLTHEGVTLL